MAATKNYLVQQWNAEGALINNYEVSIESARELVELKKFLKAKHPKGHVLITREADRSRAAPPVRKK
jgi:hypothetical protein